MNKSYIKLDNSWTSDFPQYIQNIDKELSENIESIIEHDDNIFIIKSNNNEYISIGKSVPAYWIKIDDNKEDIINEYLKTQNEEYESFESIIRAFIGTNYILNLKMTNIESQLIIDKYTDNYIWGSKWDYYPFEKKKYLQSELFNVTKMAMEQIENYYSFSIETLYSRSIVTIIDYDGIYIVEIQYNPVSINEENIKNINNKLGTNYPIDLPIDVLIVLNKFPFIDHKGILETEKITNENLLICNLICAGDDNIIDEIRETLGFISLDHDVESVREAADNLLNC